MYAGHGGTTASRFHPLCFRGRQMVTTCTGRWFFGVCAFAVSGAAALPGPAAAQTPSGFYLSQEVGLNLAPGVDLLGNSNDRACARLTDEGQPVEVRQREGVTDHLHPESCAGRCEAAGEALTGARTGRATEHRKVACLECRDRARG